VLCIVSFPETKTDQINDESSRKDVERFENNIVKGRLEKAFGAIPAKENQ
jgi:hypothetical protein